MKSLTLKQFARKEGILLSEVKRRIDVGMLQVTFCRGVQRVIVPEHPLPTQPTYAQIAEYTGKDQADVAAAMKDGLIKARTRSSVDAWMAAGCPSPPRGIDSEDEAESIATARAGALSPEDVLAVMRDRERLRVEVSRLEREVARVRLELARREEP